MSALTLTAEIPMTETKSPKKTMQQRVYHELRHSLMVGAFAPGQTVSLRKLAESLQTSLMPVREAVNRLVAERAFEMLPNRTVIIPNPDAEKLAELMRWRRILEGAAAEEACTNIDARKIKELESINKKLLRAVKDNELQLVLLRNQEFHFKIYEASGNTILLPMIESLWLQSGPFMYYSLAAPQLVWNAVHHVTAMDALREKQPKKVKKAIQEDIQAAADFLLKSHLFNKASPRPISAASS